MSQALYQIVKKPKVNYDTYNAAQLNYAITMCLGEGTKMSGPTQDDAASRALGVQARDCNELLVEIVQQYLIKSSRLAAKISPLNVTEQAVRQGYDVEVEVVVKDSIPTGERVTTFTKIVPQNPDEDAVSEKVYAADQKFSFVDPTRLVNMFPKSEILPYDVSLANTCFLAAMFTKHDRDVGVMQTFNFSALHNSKLGFEAARVAGFARDLSVVMANYDGGDAVGNQWAHVIYQYLMDTEGSVRAKFTAQHLLGKLCGGQKTIADKLEPIMGHVTQSRKMEALGRINAERADDGEIPIVTEGHGYKFRDEHYANPPMVYQYKLRNPKCGVPERELEETLAVVATARELRGRGDKSLSAVMHGSYLGVPLSKESVKLMSRVGIIENFIVEDASCTGFLIVNPDAIQNKAILNTVHLDLLLPKSVTRDVTFIAAPVVEKSPSRYKAVQYMTNARNKVIFDFQPTPVSTKRKDETLDDVNSRTTGDARVKIESYLTFQPAAVVCCIPMVVPLGKFEGYQVKYYSGPQPHTMIGVVVVSKIEMTSEKHEVTFKQWYANVYHSTAVRNGYYSFHCPLYDALPHSTIRMSYYAPTRQKINIREYADLLNVAGMLPEVDIDSIVRATAKKKRAEEESSDEEFSSAEEGRPDGADDEEEEDEPAPVLATSAQPSPALRVAGGEDVPLKKKKKKQSGATDDDASKFS